jgi:hypothetical protein
MIKMNIRRIKCSGRIAHIIEKRNAYDVLVAKPEGKKTIGRPKFRWVW